MTANRDAAKRAVAAAHIRAAAVLGAFDEELARPDDAPSQPAPVTLEAVEEEMSVHREAIASTEQQIRALEAELRELAKSGPYHLIGPTDDNLARLIAERGLLESDLRALEGLRDAQSGRG